MAEVVAGSPLVVIGAAAGAVEALTTLVGTLRAPFPTPIVIAQYRDPTHPSHLGEMLARGSPLPIVTVADHAVLQAGTIYVVPANRHVRISDHDVTVLPDGAGWPKPSVDLLLTSAAIYGEQLIAVILTGPGSEGAGEGRAVHEAGGTVVIQHPASAAGREWEQARVAMAAREAALTETVAELKAANIRLAQQNAALQQSNTGLAAAQQQAEAAVARHTRQMAQLVETNRAVLAANEELARANATLRAMSDTAQLSAEQAQAALAEAATLNEALQAANGALETLNEQLQATIEALNTSNADLAARDDDLQHLTMTKETLQHRLLQGVIQAQENERRRVARELHDDIGQSLTALVLAVGVIQEALPESATREQQILEDVTGLAENMMSGLRRVIADLRPPVLDDLGLVPALRRLGSDLQERAGVTVTVHADETSGRLPPAVEITLFRVAQEALTNIGKHAHARQARIVLRREPGRVTLRITDDGQGLPDRGVLAGAASDWATVYRDGAHFGLLGMQERVALLNGVLRVEGAPQRGTTVSVELPLDVT